MAHLTEADKLALMEVSRRGWMNTSAEGRQPALRNSTVSVKAYCEWVALLARLPHPPKPVRFSGSHWKL